MSDNSNAAPPENTTAAPPDNTTAGAPTITITWRGHEYFIPPSIDECDIVVLEEFEAGKAAGFIEQLLGAKQYKTMKRLVRPKVKDISELGDVIAKAYGFETLGE